MIKGKEEIEIAVYTMYRIHCTARKAIKNVADKTGMEEKELLQTFLSILNDEVQDFHPEEEEPITWEEAEKILGAV